MRAKVSAKDDGYFISGSVRSKGIAYVAIANEEMSEKRLPHSIPLVWHKDQWHSVDEEQMFEWVVASIVVVRKPINQAIYIGVAGEVCCIGSGDFSREIIQRKDRDLIGPIRGATVIDGCVYAVGMGREVYRRNSKSEWISIDDGIVLERDSQFRSLEDIDGFSSDDIYAVGNYGEIWHFNGLTWSERESPTNLDLAKVCCCPNGEVYAVGQNGVVLRGRDSVWETIETSKTEDFTDIVWFGNSLYLCSLSSLYTLAGNELVSVRFGLEKPSTFNILSANDGVLWVIGEKDIMEYDGKEWSRIN